VKPSFTGDTEETRDLTDKTAHARQAREASELARKKRKQVHSAHLGQAAHVRDRERVLVRSLETRRDEETFEAAISGLIICTSPPLNAEAVIAPIASNTKPMWTHELQRSSLDVSGAKALRAP